MTIALITEGGTDQVVLKPIIRAILQDEDIEFISLQPAIDKTDRQIGFGSWLLVLEQLRKLDLDDLFQTNDLVIVHIDTDVSHHKGFDIPHSETAGKVDPSELTARVIDKLRSLIPLSGSEANHDRVLYAIGVHSIECWLVGLLDSKHGQKMIGSCLENLNDGLKKDKFCNKLLDGKGWKGRCEIPKKDKGSALFIYRALAAQFSKKKTLLQQSKRNVGFANFVSQLQTVQAQIASTDQS